MNRLKQICGNCIDFDAKKGVCTIRYTILPDKTRIPMARKPERQGCQVFMYAIKERLQLGETVQPEEEGEDCGCGMGKLCSRFRTKKAAEAVRP